MIRTGLRLILEAEPDITVLAEATRRLSKSGSPSTVIVLTAFDLGAHVVDALRGVRAVSWSRTARPIPWSEPSARWRRETPYSLPGSPSGC